MPRAQRPPPAAVRLWESVPEEERYGGAWLKRLLDKDSRPEDVERWAVQADKMVADRLTRGGCAAAVQVSTRGGWGPCSNRQKVGQFCGLHAKVVARAGQQRVT